MNQKGFTPLFIILGVLVILGTIIGIYYLNTKKVIAPQPILQNPIIFSQTPQTTISPSPSISSSSSKSLQTDKIYLVNKLNDNKTILMDAPQNGEVKPQNQTGYIVSEVKINSNLYSVSPQDGGRGGPCPIEDFGTKCGYIDDQIDVKPPLKIGAVRVWGNEKGIFLINPWSIDIGDVVINSILITKLHPNDVFSPDEIVIWKQLLTTIKIQ